MKNMFRVLFGLNLKTTVNYINGLILYLYFIDGILTNWFVYLFLRELAFKELKTLKPTEIYIHKF